MELTKSVDRSSVALRMLLAVHSQYITAPSDQTSLSRLYGWPMRTSGAMYVGVPVKVVVVPTRMRLTPKSISCAHTPSHYSHKRPHHNP